MKVIYELDSDKDDRYEFERHHKALDMALALYNFDEKLRSWRKYDEREAIPTEEIDNAFYELLEKYNINLDDLLN